MNFYEALNLTSAATTEDIEEAYRTLARKVHPDLNRDDPMPAEARMKLLNRIRDTLTDDGRRAEYDRDLAAGADAARVESAINETIRESRDDVLFWRRVKLTTVGGVAVGLLLSLGTRVFDLLQRRQPELVAVPAAASVPAFTSSQLETPTPVPTPPPPKAPAAAPPVKKKPGPEVVAFGSSTEEVMHLMGKPDDVEELTAQGVRILHYGKLRLVFRNNKLVPGSGIDKDR